MKQVWLWGVVTLSLLSGPVYGSELCSMMGGKCLKACTADQYAESGVFEDCKEDEECCVQKGPATPSTGAEGAPDSRSSDPAVKREATPAR